MAGVALVHGINANIVHRWPREPTPSALSPQSQANAFVPVTLDDAAPGPAPHAQPDIRVEVQRANSAIVVKWPLAARVVAMIRIDAVWLATEPMDMSAGTDTALARLVKVFGAAHTHQAYLFANRRANRRRCWCMTASASG